MEFILYLLKASIALILFYIMYQLLSGMDTFFRLKRALLLFALFFSALFPLGIFTFTVSADFAATNPAITAIPEYFLNEVTVYANKGQTSGLSSGQILLLIYGIGVTLLFIRMMIEIGSILLIIHRSEKKTIEGKTVYVNTRIDAPFSFFGWIVINAQNHSDNEIKEILLHEETHVREFHTLDTLASELYCAFFWFNPAAWLMKKEIRMNLEYLADRKVIGSGCDSQHYQFHLLRLSYHKAAAKLSNNFNVSPLKKRILMMNKNRTNMLGLTKYAFFIPLAAMLLFFFNCQKETKAAVNNEVSAVQQDEAVMPDLPVSNADEVPEPEPLKETVKFVEPVAQDKKTEEIKTTRETVFERAEVMPQFPGGDAELYKWLNDNLTYPADEAEKGVQGMVTVRFVVEKDGSIGEVQVLRGVSPALDAEAVRVVKSLPAFSPGKQDGEPVAVWFNMPVRYRLS